MFYAAAIWIAYKSGLAGRAYALFSMSEIYEGLVTTLAALLGSAWSPVYDYAGAWMLLAYLYYELYEHTRQLTDILVERVPEWLTEKVRELLRSMGLEPVKVELHPVLPGEFVARITVRVRETDFERAHSIVDRAEELLRRKLNVIATIHYEPY